jgi:hypothetical protein
MWRIPLKKPLLAPEMAIENDSSCQYQYNTAFFINL